MHVNALQTRLFREGESLVDFVVEHIPTLPERSVLVIASKIVALAEGRTAKGGGEDAKEALVRAESEWAMKTKHVWLTVKDGSVMASAGIDESNADGKFILLPRDSFEAAANVRGALCAHYRLKELGVIISDSRTIPLRKGIVGVALGYAGIRGIRNYAGTKDLYGRVFRFSRVSVVDSLAAAAVTQMGEGAECQPLALIEGARVEFTDTVDRHELTIAPEDDMYRPFFEALPKREN